MPKRFKHSPIKRAIDGAFIPVAHAPAVIEKGTERARDLLRAARRQAKQAKRRG